MLESRKKPDLEGSGEIVIDKGGKTSMRPQDEMIKFLNHLKRKYSPGGMIKLLMKETS